MIDDLAARRRARSCTAASPTCTPPATPRPDELKTYLSIAKPEWFVPIHGEYRHLVANAKLGMLMGVARDHVLLCEDGDVLRARRRRALANAGRVPAGYLYVDGIVGDVGQGVLRDRRVLAEEGVVVVVVTVDIETGKVLTGPEIITRGWVYAPEAEDLLDEACDTRGRSPSRRRSPGRARRRERSNATCVAPPASSSASAPSGGR